MKNLKQVNFELTNQAKNLEELTAYVSKVSKSVNKVISRLKELESKLDSITPKESIKSK